jgi:hypothetical protein
VDQRVAAFGPTSGRFVALDPPHPLAHPSRWPAVAGASLLVLGQFFRWGWFEDPSGSVRSIGALAQESDGFFAAVLGLGVLLVVASRSAAESGFRSVQNLPLILGGICLLEALLGYRDTGNEVAAWRNDGRADFDLGLWLALTGAVLAALGGAASTFVLRRNRVHADVVGPGRIRTLLADLMVGGVGAVVGVALWPVLIVLLGNNMAAALLTVLAVLIGPAVALSAWHRLRRRVRASGSGPRLPRPEPPAL